MKGTPVPRDTCRLRWSLEGGWNGITDNSISAWWRKRKPLCVQRHRFNQRRDLKPLYTSSASSDTSRAERSLSEYAPPLVLPLSPESAQGCTQSWLACDNVRRHKNQTRRMPPAGVILNWLGKVTRPHGTKSHGNFQRNREPKPQPCICHNWFIETGHNKLKKNLVKLMIIEIKNISLTLTSNIKYRLTSGVSSFQIKACLLFLSRYHNHTKIKI